MFQLSEIEKVLVLAICLSLLALTIVITVCVVFPPCWLHQCLKKLAKARKMKYAGVDGLEEGTFIKLTGTPQYTVDCGAQTRMLTTTLSDVSQHGYKNHNRKREDSTYSSMSSSSQGNASVSNYMKKQQKIQMQIKQNELLEKLVEQLVPAARNSLDEAPAFSASHLPQSEASVDTPTVINDSKDDQDMNYGQVTFSMWCGANENGTIGQLIVVLREAQYLPPRQYGGACDPYLVLYMFRDKSRKRWSKNNNSMLYQFRTSTQRKTQHPLFKETFVMDVTKADLKENALKIVAFDDEKYANDSELGEITIPLRDIPFGTDGEEHVITMDFLEPKQDQGELLFGLSYLPTAERLTVNVVKAHNLKVTTPDVEAFAPFIRVLLIHNGKLLKKKKTSTRPGTASPVFSESLTFDVPPAQLDHVVFLLVASHRENPEDAISSPDSPTTPPNNECKKGRHIGKVVIGSFVRGLGLNHWNAMKQSPRKQVTQWHNLR